MNFDSTVIGKPFLRTNKIVIDYPAPNTAEITTTNQECVKLIDGTYVPLGGEFTVSFSVREENMGDHLAISDKDTGAPLAVEMTYGQLMLGITAAIRAHAA